MERPNRTSLRRNNSDQKDIKINKQPLPQLVRCQDGAASALLKKYHFDQYRLKGNNQKDNLSQKANNLVLTGSLSQVVKMDSKNGLAHLRPLLQLNIKTATVDKYELKQVKSTLKKRRTLPSGTSLFGSEKNKQNSLQGNDLSLQISQNDWKQKGRLSHRLLTRQYSHQSIIIQLEGKYVYQDDKKSIFFNRQTKKEKIKLQCYHQFIKQQTQLHDVQLRKMESYQDQKIFFSVGQGNNKQLILETMKKRWWWSHVKEKETQTINFLWAQLKDPKYGNLLIEKQQLQTDDSYVDQEVIPPEITSFTLHNHFQTNKYLGSKLSLYLTIKAFCLINGLKLCETLLPTFFVTKIMDQQWKSFTKSYFESLQISKIDNWDVGTNKRYWIIKHFSQNCTKDKIFSTYKEIKLYIEKQSKNGSRFLIQRYISKPFLYKKRKFDIRCYALIVRLKQKTHVYLHHQGVISTACEPFDIRTLDNQFSNFTTESVQVQHDKFGEFQPGNKIDFKQFQNHLDTVYGNKYSLMEGAFPVMQESVSIFAKANYKLVSEGKRGPCFELVQCEFIVDEDFKPWLIDVHTNPCLETYCPALEKVIPQVVEDTFRHTLDVLFPPPLQWPQNKHHLLPQKAKETGFNLILDGLGQEESEGERVLAISGLIDSDSNIYEDIMIDDTEYIESCTNLNDFEYLLTQSMHIQ